MKIDKIEENMGVRMFYGAAEEAIRVGDSLLILRDKQEVGECTVVGVTVGGKLLDRAQVGETAGCLLRGTASSLVEVGDHLRLT